MSCRSIAIGKSYHGSVPKRKNYATLKDCFLMGAASSGSLNARVRGVLDRSGGLLLLLPCVDPGTDRGHRRRHDAEIFLRPPDRNAEPFGVGGAKVVGSGMRLRREVFDPHNLLGVGVGERSRCRPAATLPRALANVAAFLGSHRHARTIDYTVVIFKEHGARKRPKTKQAA